MRSRSVGSKPGGTGKPWSSRTFHGSGGELKVTSSWRRFPSAVAESNRCDVLESRSLAKTYRALIKRSMSPSGGTLLHLIRDDAEASLCGIPRSSLASSGMFDEVVCDDCLDWFEKRRAVSGAFPPADRA